MAFDFLKNIFGGSGESILGIDVGTSSIKIVQLKKSSGRVVLETYGAISLGPTAGVEAGRATNLPPEKVSDALRSVVSESGATAKSCGVAIPSGASLMTIIELPELRKEELNKIIPNEARKYVPVPMEEVTLDWWVIPKFESSDDENRPVTPTKSEVLLIALHNETVNRYRDAVNGAKLSPAFFEVEIFSAMRAAMPEQLAPTMIIDMGAGTTKVYIIERGIVRVSHTISRGSQDMTLALAAALNVSVERAESIKRSARVSGDGQERQVTEVLMLSLEAIFGEANRTLLAFEKKSNRNVGRVVLIGGGAGLNGIVDVARKNFETPVELADPFSKMDAPAYLENVLKDAGPEFAVAIGAGLRRIGEI